VMTGRSGLCGRSDISLLKNAQLFGVVARRRYIASRRVAVMALGRRRSSYQGELFLTSADLPQSPGHAFYDRLNELLAEADFDRFVENLCQPHYAHQIGRPSLPPGTYFRMLFVGYFEGIDSPRGIAWRCADRFSLRAFLAIPPTEASPDHSSLTKIRQRLPEVVHERVFAHVLAIAHEKNLLKGKTVGVDSTTREANAAMRAIVRKDTGEDYKAYRKRLAKEAGMENPTDEALVRFDRKRKDKTTSNTEWVSATDADSRIAKMKDGRTHLAYKAEHAVDLEKGRILAAGIHPADTGDTATLVDSRLRTEVNLVRADVEIEVEEVVADKGYHKARSAGPRVRSGGAGRTSRSRRGRSGSGPTNRTRGGGRRRQTVVG